ncbi:hypothetical protein LX32DRAFT_643977 [Colletotrichum zoysiae]|uniref:Secreted protein n=1 Tax=Colletotrichum zoysiae TaxID=1216348 RepID=A0AAD9H7V0_9PEZI|nr:hypothetical protein LX32DRAFT_643977 [Colletotrichum zoysiae]
MAFPSSPRQHLSFLFLLLLSRAESSGSRGGEPLPSSRATRRLGQIIELGTPRIPSSRRTALCGSSGLRLARAPNPLKNLRVTGRRSRPSLQQTPHDG